MLTFLPALPALWLCFDFMLYVLLNVKMLVITITDVSLLIKSLSLWIGL